MTTTALESQGVQLKRGDGTTSESFTSIGQIVSFSGPGGAASVIDITTLDSTAREKMMGLPDEGQMTFDVILNPANAQHTGVKDDRANRTLRNFQLDLSDTGSTVISFSGYVTGFQMSGGVDDKIMASITIEITGALSWST